MYVDSNMFWWSIAIFALIILGLYGEIRSLKSKIEKIEDSEEERTDRIYKLIGEKSIEIDEIEKILEYLHPDIEKIKYSMHKESARRPREESILKWCKTHNLNKTETQKALKKYLSEWEKEYDKNNKKGEEKKK